MYKEFLETDQRPYPIPERQWIMTQVWRDLLFLHWPVPTDQLRPYIPAPLELDEYKGSAWISIIPMKITNVRIRGLPLIPFMNSYLELNVRTYVTCQGKPGIYFFSLDANHPLAVLGAKLSTGLPYKQARMSYEKKGRTIRFYSRRLSNHAGLDVEYRPDTLLYEAARGTLDFWLLERYCLYTFRGGHLYRGDIHHDQWKITKAEVQLRHSTMDPFLHLDLYGDLIIHYSSRRRLFLYPLEKLT